MLYCELRICNKFLVVEMLNLPPISIFLGFDLISKLKFTIKVKDHIELILDDILFNLYL